MLRIKRFLQGIILFLCGAYLFYLTANARALGIPRGLDLLCGLASWVFLIPGCTLILASGLSGRKMTKKPDDLSAEELNRIATEGQNRKRSQLRPKIDKAIQKIIKTAPKEVRVAAERGLLHEDFFILRVRLDRYQPAKELLQDDSVIEPLRSFCKESGGLSLEIKEWECPGISVHFRARIGWETSTSERT